MLLPRLLSAILCPTAAMQRLIAGGGCLLAPALLAAAVTAPLLLPQPAEIQVTDGSLPVTTAFTTTVRGGDARLPSAVGRLLHQWEERSGLTFARDAQGGFTFSPPASLVVECDEAGQAVPALGEDESYSLEVDTAQARLHARTTVGVLRGLATLQQLLHAGPDGWFLPAGRIEDRPRFPWRGLLIDVCRHWQPPEVIKRTLDGMALVKLNVLHLHLTEDQGFRIESRTHPRLHELGSDGHYFTQAEMRDLIVYAADRGIRIVPEFDVPGHATSWLVAYPDLAAAAGPYALERHWGVFDPVLDPTNEAVYTLLADFLGEMAALFPDPYVHIGGDENNGKQWNTNPHVQAFIREHALHDNAGLHAYFNRRVHGLLARHGKKLMGWEEILQPDLPADSVVHAWRGKDSLLAAVRRGYPVVLSKGYYIDLMQTAAEHYAIDPVAAPAEMTNEEQRRVLGGEATMWSEWVDAETIDSRIWPRTAAIAERFWSPREVRDVPALYRRLAVVSQRLEEAGLLHVKNCTALRRGYIGASVAPEVVAAWHTFVEALEPASIDRRRRLRPDATQFTPLTSLVDCTVPDSVTARGFGADVDQLLLAGTGEGAAALARLRQVLLRWRTAAETLQGAGATLPHWTEMAPVVQAFKETCVVGDEALTAWAEQHPPSATWREARFRFLAEKSRLPVAVQLPMLPAVRLLVVAATEQPQRAMLTPADWRRHLHELASGASRSQSATRP